MSLINEYIDKRLSGPELESELQSLIAKYNEYKGSYLFVYAAAIGKPIPSVSLEQSDFYIFRDFLSDKGHLENIDVYLETPGGSGETAEEIGRFLHDKFQSVSFVISGEAKSAGTIIALSGDEILMTESGSLGPIDAQVKIGRSVVSAHDYMEWIKVKRDEAQKQGHLNPFDATMVAQISPGELGMVYHSLKFAEDLVQEWLVKYKFKNWNTTETRKEPVTDDIKRKRAEEIAQELTNHTRWRSHGRSIKIGDLEYIGLKVTRIDDDPKLADLVYRIHTVCRLLFDTTTSFKIFATKDHKIFRQAVPVGEPIRIPDQPAAEVAEIKHVCEKCGREHKIYAKFTQNPAIDMDLKSRGFVPFPKDAKLICDCGYQIDLSGIKSQIEMQMQKSII